ncbi:hypothetical protein DPMN_172100 [Dreissena polymorpha]|uniref:Uncharacterized protein n=1 Tax=Dreissena polymorpha TaxID=45954 RepID=A0A9D4E2Y9_DREPO|nr:hypothetical protein DPMN_172100 [Dreissena polymorpha]
MAPLAVVFDQDMVASSGSKNGHVYPCRHRNAQLTFKCVPDMTRPYGTMRIATHNTHQDYDENI